jgi:squalene cyclase
MRGRELVQELSRRELPQGGWSFGNSRQPSVEATTLAILALAAEFPEVPAHSVRFLLSVQRGDGSWPAFKGDDDGSWTTALAALASSRVGGDSRVLEKATAWLLDTKGREAHWLWRWKFKTADHLAGIDPDKYGWPWMPGANSWVIPTAFAVIALKQFSACNPSEEANRRIRTGIVMLLDRACVGGGWNAGNCVVYGCALKPHIEATAAALMALQDEPRSPLIMRSVEWLRGQTANLRAVSSLSWSILCLFLFGASVDDLKFRLDAQAVEVSRIQNNSTLAISALALQCGETIHPFALIR